MSTHHPLRDRLLGGACARRARRQLLSPLLTAGLALSCWAGEDHDSPQGKLAGELRGVVRFMVPQLAPEPLSMAGAPDCQSLNKSPVSSQTMVSDAEGRLANVFLYVAGAEESGDSAPIEAVELEERGCLFQPRVVGARVGQTLRIVNRDPTVHDVSVDATVNPNGGQTQPFAGMTLERTLEEAEVMIPVRCEIHPWMRAWVGVLPHSHFAVSDAVGEFAIGDLPPGHYRLEAWHESLGRRSMEIAILPGQITRVEVAFGEQGSDEL